MSIYTKFKVTGYKRVRTTEIVEAQSEEDAIANAIQDGTFESHNDIVHVEWLSAEDEANET